MIVMELFSGTFYLLMISLGFLAGALVAFLGGAMEFQIIVAALVGSIATIFLRQSRLITTARKVDPSRDPNVNLDIGQFVQVHEWTKVSQNTYSARAMHRGAMWDIVFEGHEAPGPGSYKIIEIQGSQLIVERS
jgi:membrane protein implicated in regulation of membrane protease activity